MAITLVVTGASKPCSNLRRNCGESPLTPQAGPWYPRVVLGDALRLNSTWRPWPCGTRAGIPGMVQRRNEMFAEILKAVFIVILEALGWAVIATVCAAVLIVVIVGVTMLYVILFGESEDRPV